MPWHPLLGLGSGPGAPAAPLPDLVALALDAERQDSVRRRWRPVANVSSALWASAPSEPMAYERIETAVASTWSAVVVPLVTQWSRIT